MTRIQKLKLNIMSSVGQQITSVICGFILPRVILTSFGSEVNGLVSSISQFLSFIVFLELGVGAVVQSSLYKPLSEKDDIAVSSIIVSANKFFRNIAHVLVGYILVLVFVYPFFVDTDFSFVYIATLIGSISISSFAQYYFGIVDGLLLTADQRGYVQYTIQIISLIANTVFCYVIINLGGGIQFVKLVTSIIFLVKPVILRLYVQRHYNIDRKIKYEGEPIKQKWNGVAQHIAAVILDYTDTIVLTVFSTLSNVSIYMVYHLVVHGVKTMFTSMTKGIESLLGELWAKGEINELRKTFDWVEWSIHVGTTFVFGCTASLIVPFVRVYTAGVNDTNYIVPTFALLISIANGIHCLRMPYNLMILAGGHYKQTQSNYIIAAGINLVLSIITVKIWGLVGVAIGTICAMLYQTVWMAVYDFKHFLNVPIKRFLKLIGTDVCTFVAGYVICKFISLQYVSFLSFLIMAMKVALVWAIIVLSANLIMFPQYTKVTIKKCCRFVFDRKK